MAEPSVGVRLHAFGADEFQAIVKGAIQSALADFNGLGATIGRISNLAFGMSGAAKLAATGLGLFSAAVIQGTRAAAEEEVQFRRLEAVLKATGNQAGLTGFQMKAMAVRLAESTLATKEGFLEASQALATFGGVGSENFEQVLALAQDLAATGFGGLRENAQRLGRFMQDPVEGAAQLNRQLGFLTPSLKRAIEEMARSGDVAGAAALGLEALQNRVGGAGRAETDTLVGSFTQMKKAWNEMLEAFEQTGPVTTANNALASLFRATKDFLTPDTLADQARRAAATGERFARANEALPPGHPARLPFTAGAVTQHELMQDLRRRDRAIVDAQAAEQDAAGNRRAQQADDVARALDAQARKAAELSGQQTLLNRVIAESGDPTGAYAAALARIDFQLKSLEDPVQKTIRLMQEEATTITLTGAARARHEGAMRAEQAARESGRAVTEKEKQDAADAAEAKFREAQAIDTARMATELANEAARQQDQDRKDAFERGRKLLDDRAKLEHSYEREVEENEKLIAALRQSNTEYEKQKALLEILQRYRQLGLPLTDPEEIQRAEELADKLGRQREIIDDLKDRYRDLKAAGRDFANAISTAFEDAVLGGKQANEVALAFLQTVERIAFRVAFTKPLEGALEGLFSSFNPFSFFFGNARGNAFAGGQLVPFAHGAVFDSRQVFAFSRGGVPTLGELAERGTEGVIPLRRMVNGDLGVQGVGAGAMVKVEVIDLRTAETSAPIQVEQVMSQLGPVVRVIARDEVSRGLEDFSRRGGLGHTLRADYGIHKPPISRG